MIAVIIVGCSASLPGQITQRIGTAGEENAGQASFETLVSASSFAPIATKAIIPEGQTVFVRGSNTVAMVSANAFVHLDGSPVQGPVEFSMTEVNTKAGLILGNLPTVADGKLLRSGGVVKLEATSAGQELKLGPGQVVELQFADKDPEMQLFEGVPDERGTMNWIPMAAPTNPSGPNKSDAYASGGFDGKGMIRYDDRYTFDDPELLASISAFEAYGTIDNQTQKFSKSRTFASQYILKLLKDHYPCTGTEKLNTHIEFSRKGVPTSIQVTSADNPCFQRAVVEICSRLRWSSIDDHRAVTIQLPINIKPTGSGSENAFRSMAGNDSLQLDRASREALEKLNAIQIQREEDTRIRTFAREAMHATEIGWLNLDVYIRNSQNVDVLADMQDAPDGTSTFLVLDEMRAVVPPKRMGNGQIAFINVPKGLSAKIIAISTDPTKGIRLGILPIITRQGQVGNIDTQPISAENLVKQLEAL
ncbi:MAG TPA: hypothetical protein VHS96_00695 [Bacteroidia bacterium]|nr:hypothetical protein [Bacteroidia bacterium]